MSVRLPLSGIRIIDLTRLAPGPFCTMQLADFGADVILVEAPRERIRSLVPREWDLTSDDRLLKYDALRRNKRSIILDLKTQADRDQFLNLVRTADVVIEGFRPGVAERLGASYLRCTEANPRIIYCSITGYGQQGPHKGEAGHDINYISLAGVLDGIGSGNERPAIPLNLIADYAAGGLYAALAVMMALFHRERTGEGQAIDISMVDASLSLMTHAATLFFAYGVVPKPRKYFLAGGLPYYDVYRCADGRWVSVGAMEPHFFANLCVATGRPELGSAHGDSARFSEIADHLGGWFANRWRADALSQLSGRDTCVTPVLSLREALDEAETRGMVVSVTGAPQLGVAPKLSRTPGRIRRPPPRVGEDGDDIRRELRSSSINAATQKQ